MHDFLKMNLLSKLPEDGSAFKAQESRVFLATSKTWILESITSNFLHDLLLYYWNSSSNPLFYFFPENGRTSLSAVISQKSKEKAF